MYTLNRTFCNNENCKIYNLNFFYSSQQCALHMQSDNKI